MLSELQWTWESQAARREREGEGPSTRSGPMAFLPCLPACPPTRYWQTQKLH